MILRLLAPLLLVGCASTQTGAARPPALPDGFWYGAMTHTQTKADGKVDVSNEYLVVMYSCEGKLRFATGRALGELEPVPATTQVSSLKGTQLQYFLQGEATSSDWEELQAFSLLHLEPDRAWMLWTRVVNNRTLKPADSDRFFYTVGQVELTRAKTGCVGTRSP